MPGFAMTPAAGFNPQTGEQFPEFIQFQNQGDDLGGPDADVLNFAEGLTATRGTGENENVVTVTAEGGGGGGAETLLLQLEANSPAAFDGAPFNDWTAYQRVASADAQWLGGEIVFLRTGTYRITVVGRIYDSSSSWNTAGETYYGSTLPGAAGIARSGYSRKADAESIYLADAEQVAFTDEYYYNVHDIETITAVPALYGNNYFDSAQSASMEAMVAVTRIGDAQTD